MITFGYMSIYRHRSHKTDIPDLDAIHPRNTNRISKGFRTHRLYINMDNMKAKKN